RIEIRIPIGNSGGMSCCRTSALRHRRLTFHRPPRRMPPIQVSMGSEMEKNPVRRIVTGHDADGKAVILIDAPTPYVNHRGEGNVTQLLWITNESPVDLSHNRDQASQKTGVPPPRSGSICRIVDFAPIKGELPHGVDHNEIL